MIMTLGIILKYNNMDDPFANGIHALLFQLIFYNVVNHLFQSVFSHGQLYVAISRVTSRDGIKILLIDENDDCINTTSNVAYKYVF